MKFLLRWAIPLLLCGTAPAIAAPAPLTAMPANYSALATYFTEWRAFVAPPVTNGVADYSAAGVARQAAAFPAWQARLAEIDQTGWSKAARIDHQIVSAEVNAFDFNLRVLKPWARDPGFYANIAADWSDVPAHEGQTAQPNIDLYAWKWPLNAADDKKLTALLAAVPANLAAAKINLAGSNAKDLWTYGSAAYHEQSATLAALAAGTLKMKTLDGMVPATMTGASPALRQAIAAAKAATDDFAAWVAAEAPKKTGPSGVGKDNYNWHAKNVMLVPYDWDAQVTLLQRELDRSIAGLRLEEVRNRNLPPIVPLTDPAEYAKFVAMKEARFSAFLTETGLSTGEPYMTTAIAHQAVDFAGPDSHNFFSNVTRQDPLPLISHFTHWIDLARMREAPSASPIRRVPPAFNIYANRSEGFATAFEEIVMQAGLYDDVPHGRELVYIMLANRAARGLASLRVQANEIDLATAGKFHAGWTPRGWSDANSKLVGFEQLLYARQPGYGPSYIIGKIELDHLMAAASHADDVAGKPFVMADFIRQVMAAGIMPVALIEDEMLGTPR